MDHMTYSCKVLLVIVLFDIITGAKPSWLLLVASSVGKFTLVTSVVVLETDSIIFHEVRVLFLRCKH